MDFEFTYTGIPLEDDFFANDAEYTVALSYTRNNGSGKLKSFQFFYTDVLIFSVEYEELNHKTSTNIFVDFMYLFKNDIMKNISNINMPYHYSIKDIFGITITKFQEWLKDKSGITKNSTYYSNLYYHKIDSVYYIQNHLRAAFQHLFHLDYTSANRSRAQRAYTKAIAPYTYDTFAVYTKKDLNYDDAKVREFVHFWMTNKERGFGLVEDLDIFMENETIFVRIKHNGGMRGNLTEVGFSVAQILPLVVRIAINDTQFALVEEPETNLHPKLQARLADMFMEAYTQFGTRFIVETHSEYFIRKLQWHTAKGNIKPEDTAVYYLYDPNDARPADEPQVKRLRIDENGDFDMPFGTGFFDEATNLMLNIYRAKT